MHCSLRKNGNKRYGIRRSRPQHKKQSTARTRGKPHTQPRSMLENLFGPFLVYKSRDKTKTPTRSTKQNTNAQKDTKWLQKTSTILGVPQPLNGVLLPGGIEPPYTPWKGVVLTTRRREQSIRKWTWTTDQKIFNLLLYQLSYPNPAKIEERGVSLPDNPSVTNNLLRTTCLVLITAVIPRYRIPPNSVAVNAVQIGRASCRERV